MSKRIGLAVTSLIAGSFLAFGGAAASGESGFYLMLGEIQADPALGGLTAYFLSPADGQEEFCADGVWVGSTDEEDLEFWQMEYFPAGGGYMDQHLYSNSQWVVSVEDSFDGVHFFPPIDGDPEEIGCFDYGALGLVGLDIGLLVIEAP